ncbi:hypothetical protein D3C85_259230 [compost metagenome]
MIRRSLSRLSLSRRSLSRLSLSLFHESLLRSELSPTAPALSGAPVRPTAAARNAAVTICLPDAFFINNPPVTLPTTQYDDVG